MIKGRELGKELDIAISRLKRRMDSGFPLGAPSALPELVV
jgi:hypothetical protein